jgi:hypothetical protein
MFDAIVTMKQEPFANMIFHTIKEHCDTVSDFEEFLSRQLPEDGIEALHTLQRPNFN